jgi:RND family efflux transporter MFP subunit
MPYKEEDAGEPAHGEAPNAGHAQSRRGWVVAIAILIVIAAVVIAGVVPRLRARAALRTATYDLAVPSVSAIHPKVGAPQTEIVLPGNIQAFIDSPIYARTNGYLKNWYADIGAHVKKGQLLADIETPEVDQQLDQGRADLNTARANYNLSEITAARYEGLLKTDSVSKQDVDNAEGAYRANQAIVTSAEANVRRLEELQSFEKIYAPFDGIITARNTDIGHLIDSGASGGTAQELFHIASTNVLRVYVNVPQEDSQSAKPGLAADLTLQEFPGRRFPGMLVRTAKAIDPTSRTLLVEVDVGNSDGTLLPGAFTEVHLQIPSGVRAAIVPVSALIFRSQGLQIGIVENGNRATLKDVTLGRDFGNEVEVVSGVSANDLVIVNPPDSLVTGEIVRIAPTEGAGNTDNANQ